MTGRPGLLDTISNALPMASGLRAALVLAVLCVAGVACEQASMQELAEGQKQILERLEKLEKAQQQLLAASRGGRQQRPQVDYNKVYSIEEGDSPVRGAQDAAVVLVEFSDFQCPYSKRVQPLIESLLEAYPDDLKHVYKNYPLRFHKRAEPAARACIAAGMQGRYWEMHAKVFENPKKLEDTDLEAYARQIGLDVDRFRKDYESDAVKKRVGEDVSAARKAQVTGTPTLFLNGKRVRDRSPEAMKKAIDDLRGAQKNG